MSSGDYDVSVQVHLGKKKKKSTILVSDADSGQGQGYVCVGAGATGEISVTSSHFCCQPKTALFKKDLLRSQMTQEER